MIGRICYGLALVCLIILACLPAFAHEAASGWAYSSDCCSGKDCAVAPAGAVIPTADGWMIQIQPGQHPAVTEAPWSEVIPYTSDRIRPSGDADFHVCIGLISKAMFCLYTPEGQWGS